MSHRRVCSHGNVPFSWEDSPGVSKIIGRKGCPPDHAFNLSSSSSIISSTRSTDCNNSETVLFGTSITDEIKINPPPPCPKLQPPRRSTSAKGFKWWQEDPFLAAYKECTKNVIRDTTKINGKYLSRDHSSKKTNNNNNINNIAGSKVVGRRRQFIFSCKNSCDVKDDNLVSLSNLPPISRAHRVRAV